MNDIHNRSLRYIKLDTGRGWDIIKLSVHRLFSFMDSVFVYLFLTSDYAAENSKSLGRWIKGLSPEWNGTINPNMPLRYLLYSAKLGVF